VGDLRVRHHGTHASVEIAPAEMPLLRSRWDAVERFFAGLGFEKVELDPSGYRRGRLLTLAPHGGA
jgi:PP-loop superfamily ATP-utilizing enzyme